MSYTDEKHTIKKYSPAVPDAAFTGCSAAVALSQWSFDGWEEERGVGEA